MFDVYLVGYCTYVYIFTKINDNKTKTIGDSKIDYKNSFLTIITYYTECLKKCPFLRSTHPVLETKKHLYIYVTKLSRYESYYI